MRIENKKDEILDKAINLFLQQGYTKTSMRQIAAESDVSLGLVVYHFNAKRSIAEEFLRRHLNLLKEHIARYVDVEENAILYSAVLLRLNLTILMSPRFYDFYLDVLRDDIYSDMIIDSGLDTLRRVNQQMNLGLTDKYMMIYGNCLSVSIERSLVLYSNILEAGDDIPDMIFKTYVRMFGVSEEILELNSRKSKEIVTTMLTDNPDLKNV